MIQPYSRAHRLELLALYIFTFRCPISPNADESMSVQVQLHGWPAQKSSGSGTSKSGDSRTAPACRPAIRSVNGSGTIRARAAGGQLADVDCRPGLNFHLLIINIIHLDR